MLRDIQRGDERAIDELVMTHQNGVYSYVLAMLRDRRDAEEVVQTPLLGLYALFEDSTPTTRSRRCNFARGSCGLREISP